MVIRTIHEVQDILQSSPAFQATRESLEKFRVRLANELIANNTLVRECEAHSLHEALFRLGKGPNMERKLVEFYARHQCLNKEILFRKYDLFTAQEQRVFFNIIQSKLNEKAVNSNATEEEELEQLIGNANMEGTRFALVKFLF